MSKTNKTEQSKRRMLAALEKSLGIATTALKNAEVSRTQFYHWLKEDEEFAKAVKDVENVTMDFVESQLHKQIQNGIPTSTIFYLKTKGKKRGYIERQEIEHSTGDEGFKIDLSKLDDETLAKLIKSTE